MEGFREKLFNEMIKKAFKKAIKTWRAKDNDYNSGHVGILDYFDYEGEEKMHKKVFHDIWKKTLRLRSLISSGKKPKYEALEDTCIDLMNYAAFLYAALEFQKSNNFVVCRIVKKEDSERAVQEESDC